MGFCYSGPRDLVAGRNFLDHPKLFPTFLEVYSLLICTVFSYWSTHSSLNIFKPAPPFLLLSLVLNNLKTQHSRNAV